MKRYQLYIGMPIAKFSVSINADFYNILENRLNFYIQKEYPKSNELVCSYPSQYTIIEKIEEYDNK